MNCGRFTRSAELSTAASVACNEGWYFYWLDRYDATNGEAAQTAFNDMFVKYFRNGRPWVKLQTGADEIARYRPCVREVDAREPCVGILNFSTVGLSRRVALVKCDFDKHSDLGRLCHLRR